MEQEFILLLLWTLLVFGGGIMIGIMLLDIADKGWAEWANKNATYKDNDVWEYNHNLYPTNKLKEIFKDLKK